MYSLKFKKKIYAGNVHVKGLNTGNNKVRMGLRGEEEWTAAQEARPNKSGMKDGGNMEKRRAMTSAWAMRETEKFTESSTEAGLQGRMGWEASSGSEGVKGAQEVRGRGSRIRRVLESALRCVGVGISSTPRASSSKEEGKLMNRDKLIRQCTETSRRPHSACCILPSPLALNCSPLPWNSMARSHRQVRSLRLRLRLETFYSDWEMFFFSPSNRSFWQTFVRCGLVLSLRISNKKKRKDRSLAPYFSNIKNCSFRQLWLMIWKKYLQNQLSCCNFREAETSFTLAEFNGCFS